ncbi:hypothetical protein OQA88_5821 [Cercophora sp. LCS_1]
MWKKQTVQFVAPVLLGALLSQPLTTLLGKTSSAVTAIAQRSVSAVTPRCQPAAETGLSRAWAVDDYLDTCPDHKYTIKIVSYEPLLINIANFVSAEEGEYLINLADFSVPSYVRWEDGREEYAPDVRSSSTSILHADQHMNDPVVRCIVNRAATFQGYLSPSLVEPLQVVRYRQSEHFSLHHDAFDYKQGRPNRRSSFFVILKSEDVVHGGTNFPRIQPFQSGSVQNQQRWCEIMDCEDGKMPDGVVVKPVTGSANFWLNLEADGSRREQLWHAGDRLLNGTKYGMNIFSWTAEPAPLS